MAGEKAKARLKQSAYRQRVKESGGFYVGLYVKGQAAQALKTTKEQQKTSYSRLVAQCLTNAFPQTKQKDEDKWEDLKI